MTAILNLAILNYAILVFPLKLTHTCQDCFPPFAQKNFLTLPSSPFAQKKFHSFFGSHHLHKENFTHSFWLNLMMAAILNSAILDSDTLVSSLRFTQKHSPSTLIMTQSNSIWLKLIHSQSTWWWQPSWILSSLFMSSYFFLSNDSHLSSLVPTICTKKNFLTLPFPPFARKKTSLIPSDSTWWWQPSWILPCWIQTLPSWIQTPWYLLSDSLKNTLTPLWLWLKLIQSDSNSFILTQLDDGSHLEFCHLKFHHLEFSHLSLSSQTDLTLAKIGSHHLHKKKNSLIHSLPTICTKKKLHSFILTQLDDGSHLVFCHVGFSHCHLGFRHLGIFSQIHSKTLSLHSDSDSN